MMKLLLLIGPLMPLIPGDPLTLDTSLEKKLYHTDYSQENVKILKERQFPWLQTLSIVLIMGSLPWVLFTYRAHLRSIKKKESFSPFSPLEFQRQLQSLEEIQSAQEKIAHLSYLIRHSYSYKLQTQAEARTFEEILGKVERGPHRANVKDLFEQMEVLQFAGSQVAQADWNKVKAAARKWAAGEQEK